MSWSWSHTDEAYVAAENNLRNLPDEQICSIWAEWHSVENDEEYQFTEPGFNEEKYAAAIIEATKLIAGGFRDALCDDIWQWASEQATCDNGGFNCWLCPWGCGPHCVDFE